MDGRNFPQLLEDFGTPDVARMNDVSDSRERTDRFRTKQPVRIGNETYRLQRPYSPRSSAFPREFALTLKPTNAAVASAGRSSFGTFRA